MKFIRQLLGIKTTNDILSEDVANGKPAVKRSSHWESVRKEHLKNNPACAACGGTKNVQVHHIKPFHLFPELELDLTNLISLCENNIVDNDSTNDNHHLMLGHRGDFHNNNSQVLQDVDNYRQTKSKLPKLEGYDFKNLKKLL